MISLYFDHCKQIIERFQYKIENTQITLKLYSIERGYLEGTILFIDNSRLEFLEVKDVELDSKIKYRYHYMDSRDELIFRYDNAKHHKEFDSFPNHKHDKNAVVNSTEPELNDILFEIQIIVLRENKI
jgi:hypothetical protein